MKLYWSPRTRAFRAAWLLEELGQPYERVSIDIRDDASRADPAFRAASPMGKVPALEDGPVKLWDSGAICVYLADAYPQAGLGVAVGDPGRGAFLQWALFTNAVLEPAMGEKFSGAEPKPSQNGFGGFELMLEALKAGLTPGPWILGERFTAPDTLLGSSVHFMKVFGILADGDPTLDAYADRCRARPAFQRAQALEPQA